jgi:tripartite-type tricarboxylate transporter receptor subunit TctC
MSQPFTPLAWRRVAHSLLLTAVMAGHLPAHAQDYPSRPVRMLVPFAPGGGTDGFARRFLPQLGSGLGEKIFVENKPGANAILATQGAIAAPADGHTLLLVTNAITINPFLQKELPYDAARDLQPISLVARTAHVLLVSNALPVKNVRELVEYARARPGGLNFGSGGIGSTNHLAGEMFGKVAGVRMEHIAYKGASEYLRDLTPGTIQLVFGGADQAIQLNKAGTARALAVTGSKRLAELPDVPTMAEAGYPLEIYSWTGFMASTKTPKAIVQQVAREMQAAARKPEVQKLLAPYELIGSTSEEFEAFLKKDQRQLAALLKGLNLAAESAAKK